MTQMKRNILMQMLFIFLLVILLGFTVNIFHPQSVKISWQRPSPEYAADSIFAEQLPPVSIGGEEQNDFSESDDFPVLGYAQLNRLIREGKALLIDAREEREYQEEHLPNAINIPYECYYEYEEQIRQLPREKWLVCYCEGPPCDLGEMLAQELKLRDFVKVAVYEGGLNDWKKHARLKNSERTENGG